MSLHLWVYKCPQDMRRNGQVCEYELALLVQAEQGEVVAQLHGLNGVFLLQWVRDQSEVTMRSHHPTLTAIIMIIIPVVSTATCSRRAIQQLKTAGSWYVIWRLNRYCMCLTWLGIASTSIKYEWYFFSPPAGQVFSIKNRAGLYKSL